MLFPIDETPCSAPFGRRCLRSLYADQCCRSRIAGILWSSARITKTVQNALDKVYVRQGCLPHGDDGSKQYKFVPCLPTGHCLTITGMVKKV